MPFTHLPQPFVRAECLASGVSARVLERAATSDHLARVAPGLYAVAAEWEALPAWDRHLALARTAVRVTPDAIISHASAAALLELPMPPKPPLRATMTLLDDGRTSRADDWRRFHRGHTPHEHVLLDRGDPYLVPARVIVDCLRDLDPGDALAVLDAGLGRGLVTGPELIATRRLQRRWPGIAVADRLLPLGDGRRESWLESTSAWLMASWEVPPGIPQVVIKDQHGRFVARVDVLWPELGVVGEADGRGKYLLSAPAGVSDEEVAARAVLEQARRESRVRDLGLEVVRWDTQDLGRPLVLLDRFRGAVARARPDIMTARYECSCCRRPLTDCARPTKITGFRTA